MYCFSEDEQAYVQTSMYSDMQTNESTNIQPSIPECTQASMPACKYVCFHSDVQTAQKIGCMQGFSARQINIISIVKDCPMPISYTKIAELLRAYFALCISPDAVRGIVQRLKQNKHLAVTTFHAGFARGNLYTCNSKVCKHIPSFFMQMNMQTKAEKAVQTNHSIKDRLDILNLSNLNNLNSEVSNSAREKLLSLSDDDIAFFWNSLAHSGFGKQQIEQIVKRLEQQGASLENVMQGLHYAEWDLSNGQMKDKNGELIKSPTNWVFQILARQGYYPKPKSYTSPEEQAELDDKQEAEKLEKLIKENETREFEEWKATLSEEEIATILENERKGKRFLIHFPDRILLKTYFQKSKDNQDEQKNNQIV